MIDQAQSLRALAGKSDHFSRSARVSRSEFTRKTVNGSTALAVTSGKGGVGKTNISINLALALAALKKRVILFDADLGLANVNILMGMAPIYTLNDVVNGSIGIEDILMEGPGGIWIVPAGNGFERMANLDAIALHRLVSDLGKLEEMCDFLILDTGAGISRTVRSFVAASHVQLVVVNGDPTSLADAYACIKMAHQAGATRVNVLVNQVSSAEEGPTVFGKLQAMARRFLKTELVFLGAIPQDRALAAAVVQQSPVLLKMPKSPFSISVSSIARKIAGVSPAVQPGFFKRFFHLFEDHGNA